MPEGSNTADNHLKVAQPVGGRFLLSDLELSSLQYLTQLLCDVCVRRATRQAALLKLFSPAGANP